jgi:CheY-like chemotaxis protein
MKDVKTVLIIFDNEELQIAAKEALEDSNYRVITATNSNEARLKFSNEKFDMVVVDMEVRGFKALDFVESIRRKEALKNMRDNIPVLVTSESSTEFAEDFSEIENVNFLETPFNEVEFKKKLFTFAGNSDIISSNTKLINKGEYLITEGGVSHEMYWILSGHFIITKLNQDENNVVISEVHPGELVGEMSFLDSLPRSASVKALEDSEVLVIPHKKFIDVLDGQPRWFRALMQTMSQRLRSANKMIARKVVSVDQLNDKDEIEVE